MDASRSKQTTWFKNDGFELNNFQQTKMNTTSDWIKRSNHRKSNSKFDLNIKERNNDGNFRQCWINHFKETDEERNVLTQLTRMLIDLVRKLCNWGREEVP